MADAHRPANPSDRPRDERAGAAPIAGLTALLALCALGALAAGIALALLADGQWLGGFALVGVALAAVGLLLSCVDWEPDAPLGYRALAAGATVHVRARMACISVAAWSRAGRALIRVRRRQQRLHAARRDRLAALGEAILCRDRARAAQLTAEAREIGEEMRDRDHEASAAIGSARTHIERERAARQAALVDA